MALVREVALQVDELRTGDMAFFEILPAGHNLIGDLRVGNEMGRAVEDAQTLVAELTLQSVGFDQKFGMGETLCGAHAGFSFYWCCGKEAAIDGRRR